MSGIDPQWFSGPGTPTQASDAPAAPGGQDDPAALGPACKTIGMVPDAVQPLVPMPNTLNAANRWGLPGPATPATTTPPAIDVIGQGKHAPFTGKE